MKDNQELPAIKVTKKTGREEFHRYGISLPLNLLSFWQWSSSDLVGNILRGVLAEYIVLSATGSKQDLRTEWDAYDILTPTGIKVEVKSSAFIQSWHQDKFSKIGFKIPPTMGWDAAANSSSSKKMRQSDVYIFCVLSHKNKETIDPLNLDQWDFYVLATDTLNKMVGIQENIRLSSLKKLKPIETDYKDINYSIKRVFDN